MITLRPEQDEFVADIRAALAKHQSILALAACGFGKTAVSSYIAHGVQAKGKRLIFTVHRRHLVKQTAQTFDHYNIDYGIIRSGRNHNPLASVQIAMMDSLKNRITAYEADLIIVDECHLSMSRTHSAVIKHYMDTGAKVIGLTATARRLDGKPLGDIYAAIVPSKPVRWLIDNGRLSDYRAFAPSQPDLSGVATSMGDYDKRGLIDVMDKPSITGDAVTHWRRYAEGKRTIGYCLSRDHSKRVTEAFNAAGIPAAHLDGESSDAEISDTLYRFATGEVLCLFNCALLTEGLDISAQAGIDAPIEAIISLRPTQSLALHTQQIGRVLRAKSYPAIILDHAGNLLRHGLPDDEIEWSLTGKKKRQGKEVPAVPIKNCPTCFAMFAPAPICPYCGHAFKVEAREIEEDLDADLAEINADMLAERRKKKEQQAMARNEEELIILGQERGYKNPAQWARHVMSGRRR